MEFGIMMCFSPTKFQHFNIVNVEIAHTDNVNKLAWYQVQV